MTSKKMKIVYWVSTGLLTLMMLMSASMYLFKTGDIRQSFQSLGYPSYIVIPLAIAKLSGLVAVWFAKNQSIKEWAYAGFFFNFLLALVAHLSVGDGEFGGALVAIVLLFVSYFSSKKIAK